MEFPKVRLHRVLTIALCLWVVNVGVTEAACKCGPFFCFLPVDSGPCDACLPRYRYVPERNVCVEFVYGGCGGNKNRFMTRAECERTCQRP